MELIIVNGSEEMEGKVLNMINILTKHYAPCSNLVVVFAEFRFKWGTSSWIQHVLFAAEIKQTLKISRGLLYFSFQNNLT